MKSKFQINIEGTVTVYITLFYDKNLKLNKLYYEITSDVTGSFHYIFLTEKYLHFQIISSDNNKMISSFYFVHGSLSRWVVAKQSWY